MGLKLPEERQEGGLFLRSDVRTTNAGGIVQSNFNTTDFDVISGVVDLKNKTSFWSCPGQNFSGNNPDIDDIVYATTNSDVTATGGGDPLVAPVFLPQGAVVTSAIVYGNAGTNDETWTLHRATLTTGAGSTMASASVNSADSTISSATIDNNTFCYFIRTTPLTATDEIFGARITYTTDYD